MKYLAAVAAIAAGILPKLVHSETQNCMSGEPSWCKIPVEGTDEFVGECCGENQYCDWRSDPPGCVDRAENPPRNSPTNVCFEEAPSCHTSPNGWFIKYTSCGGPASPGACEHDPTVPDPYGELPLLGFTKTSDYCECDLGRHWCDTGINPCRDPYKPAPSKPYNPKDYMKPAERHNKCLYDDYLQKVVPHCCNGGETNCQEGCDRPNPEDCAGYQCACELGQQYCNGEEPCAGIEFDGLSYITFDEYDYYDDPQDEVDYMSYLSLTVRGKLNKLSAYCPHGYGGLKVANAATVDKIENAADVNNDQVLSLTEYQSLPQIVVKYCNTKAAVAVAVAATKESSGDAKSGKGAGGRKRKRVSRGNMKY